MKQNVGVTDKRVRVAVGAIAGTLSLATLAGLVSLSGTAAIVLGVAALMLLGTAATGMCGLYSVLGINTCAVSPDESR